MERTSLKNKSYLSFLFILLRCIIFLMLYKTTQVNSVKSETQAMVPGDELSLAARIGFPQEKMYLSQFGYINPAYTNPQSGHLMTEDMMTKAIEEFQSFAGLNVSGHLDNQTLFMMNLPRCGVRDKVGYATDSRSKRYALQGNRSQMLDSYLYEFMRRKRLPAGANPFETILQDIAGYWPTEYSVLGSRWRVKDLTYKVSRYPASLRKSEVDDEVKKAFSVWSSVTPLTFTKKSSGPVHIEIRFERGEHGDGDPFDGPGGTLAHAFFPVYGGDAHFDDAEKWTVNTPRGTNLFQVAAHEFGHSLGLSHSDVRSALMAPFYRGYEQYFTLDDDDVEAIQALYGKKKDLTDSAGEGSDKRPTNEDAPTEEDGELCTDATIDAIFNSAEGVTYAFKGEHYWKLTEDSIAPGYPKLISKSWPGLPGKLDAAFTYKNGKTYFFKGSKYWRYTGKKVDGDYPKEISEGFTGIPDSIDAAMVWSGNGKIYFFKGKKFWRFDPTQKPPVKNTYPKPIANWEGIPDNLDAALHYTNGYTYFFKGGSYYRFNDRNFAVDSADPPFPRNAGYWWFGCRSATKGAISSNNNDNLSHGSSSVNSHSLADSQLHSEQHKTGHDYVNDMIQDADPDDFITRDNKNQTVEKNNKNNSSCRLTGNSPTVIFTLMFFLLPLVHLRF